MLKYIRMLHLVLCSSSFPLDIGSNIYMLLFLRLDYQFLAAMVFCYLAEAYLIHFANEFIHFMKNASGVQANPVDRSRGVYAKN